MTPTQQGLSSALRKSYRIPSPLRILGWVLFIFCGLAMAAILISDPLPDPAAASPAKAAAPAEAQPAEPADA